MSGIKTNDIRELYMIRYIGDTEGTDDRKYLTRLSNETRTHIEKCGVILSQFSDQSMKFKQLLFFQKANHLMQLKPVHAEKMEEVGECCLEYLNWT